MRLCLPGRHVIRRFSPTLSSLHDCPFSLLHASLSTLSLIVPLLLQDIIMVHSFHIFISHPHSLIVSRWPHLPALSEMISLFHTKPRLHPIKHFMFLLFLLYHCLSRRFTYFLHSSILSFSTALFIPSLSRSLPFSRSLRSLFPLSLHLSFAQ